MTIPERIADLRSKQATATPLPWVKGLGKWIEAGSRGYVCGNFGLDVDCDYAIAATNAFPELADEEQRKEPSYRVGRTLGTTIYNAGEDQPCIWVPDNKALAARIVDLLNRAAETEDQSSA